jgi:hypothetical protein
MQRRSLALALLLAFLATVLPVHAATVPSNLLYEGRLLNSSGSPVTSAVVLRFSFWKSADWTSADASGGSINTSATNYGGWYETQQITPTSNGIVMVQLGSGTTLPTIDFNSHKYIQVEVKSVGQPDTSYVLLDPTGDNGADLIDRKYIASVAYAKNAESVGNRTVGTSSGNVLILGPDGRVPIARMGSGTNSMNFSINGSNASGDATLTFGHSVLQQTLKYSDAERRFKFSDDIVIQGGVRIESGGGLTASGSITTDGGITINKDNTAADATLTFGSSLGTKTLIYSSVNRRFEFSDNVSITGNLTVSGRINGLAINSLSPLRVASGAGLTISVASGSYRLGSSIVNYTGSASVTVTASATQYVFFGSGGLKVQTAAFPTDESFIPLAVVTTSASGVTAVSDRRVLQTDIREHDEHVMLTAEFDKATYQGDGSSNVGQLLTAQDAVTLKNYYLWTSTRPSLQDYDVFVRFQLPRDFVRWKTSSANPLRVAYRSTSASTANNKLDISVYDTSGTAVTLSGSTTNLASTSWTTTDISFLGSPTWTAGQELLMKFHLSSGSGFQMHLGSVDLRYTVLTGQ